MPSKAARPCQYGDKCTRKNPAHFKEESHPRSHGSAHIGSEDDSDSDADDAGGAAARRQSPPPPPSAPRAALPGPGNAASGNVACPGAAVAAKPSSGQARTESRGDDGVRGGGEKRKSGSSPVGGGGSPKHTGDKRQRGFGGGAVIATSAGDDAGGGGGGGGGALGGAESKTATQASKQTGDVKDGAVQGGDARDGKKGELGAASSSVSGGGGGEFRCPQASNQCIPTRRWLKPKGKRHQSGTWGAKMGRCPRRQCTMEGRVLMWRLRATMDRSRV